MGSARIMFERTKAHHHSSGSDRGCSVVRVMENETTITRALTPKELGVALALRHEVFVREQGIPEELDRDGGDRSARHVLVYSGGRAVATGRVIISTSGEATLARIAVVRGCRGRGLGRKVVEELEVVAKAAGATTLRLHPHHYLEAFYESLGYETVSGTEFVAGYRLITMTKGIPRHHEETTEPST
jgi:predicted GNAT family N-acyltransferase